MIQCVEMSSEMKKLLRCQGCFFLPYIALDSLFIQDLLCQIRFVIKIKSMGKSAELENIWKETCCPKFATLENSFYGSIVLFLFPLKDKFWKIRKFIS